MPGPRIFLKDYSPVFPLDYWFHPMETPESKNTKYGKSKRHDKRKRPLWSDNLGYEIVHAWDDDLNPSGISITTYWF